MTAPEPNDEASFTGQAAKDEEDEEEVGRCMGRR